MYPMRFLDVTLDTYQDTSGYMYLGRFIMIHQDTPRYKITIHVSWTRHDDTSRYNQDTSRYMYLGRFVRAALDTHKICSRCNADTFRKRILGSFYMPCCPRSWRRRASTCTCIQEAEERQGSCGSSTCTCQGSSGAQEAQAQGAQGVQAHIQSPQRVGIEIRILMCIPMYPTRIVSVSCVSCIWGLRYIVS